MRAFRACRVAVLMVVVGAGGARAEVTLADGRLVAAAGRYRAVFSAEDGNLLALSQTGREGSILRGGEQGLWRVRFRDESLLDASSFKAGDATRPVTIAVTAKDTATLTYTAPELELVVMVTAAASGLELRARVMPRQKDILTLTLPGRLRFTPQQVTRLVAPTSGGSSVGIACRAEFFMPQPEDKPSGWQPRPAGPSGYAAVYGGPLDQRPDRDPPAALRAAAGAEQWLPPAVIARVNQSSAQVNRPPTRAQAELVLVDSDHGPYFSATSLGGQGRIWRIGGGVRADQTKLVLDLVGSVLGRLAASLAGERQKLGLIALTRGPDRGGWCEITVEEWRGRLRSARAAAAGRAQVVELPSPEAVLAAARSGEFQVILNPYGEWAPVTAAGGMAELAAAVGDYVKAGGNWFEVGGYPFYYALRPLRYLKMGSAYPPAFADFQHLETTAGSAAVYGLQPRGWAPWAGQRDHRALFVPGALAWGGDEQGGYCERSFGTFVAAGQSWDSPAVRLAVGDSVTADLGRYAQANGLTRKLADKVGPALLSKLRAAVMVFYTGGAKEKLQYLDRLPVPTLVHFSDYLKGGFDKEYPDHLPPNPSFGTAEELRAFYDRCHQLGHLVMPYTNPTWWCDHPQGPTFEREGTAPLLKSLDGRDRHEQYGNNDGWSICFWHPAVQAANRKTVRQFTDEYPVDVLFQDQCGARTWVYDTNPASPTPYAYAEGILSMVDEDSRTKPLSTENGWDRVAEYQTQLCGMTWGIVPTQGGPTWRRLLKTEYPPETWSVFPLAQTLVHDKAILLHHDLGQFVTTREVLAWTLGLGYSLSYRTSASGLSREPTAQWLAWLDRLQKSVCARYVGEPVEAFTHDRGRQPTVEDDGVIRARYGPVELIANLGPTAKTAGQVALPPHGFQATAPGMLAGDVAADWTSPDGGGLCFVSETRGRGAEIWVYQQAESAVAVPLSGVTGAVRVSVDGQPPAEATVTGGAVPVKLPAVKPEPRVQPPAELAGKAPRDWPGARPAIGLIDLGAGVSPSWTKIEPAQWLKALTESRLATEWGVPVRRLATAEELFAALQAGPTAWLAVVNPYGETMLTTGAGQWRPALDAVRDYVHRGGIWWETGGYSFHGAVYRAGDAWQGESVGPSGAGHLGLPIATGEVEAPPEELTVTPTGRRWLGEALAARIELLASPVNRGAPRGNEDPGHVALVAGAGADFIAGYRLGGWGWLWRVGGFSPNPEVVLPTAVAALEFLYTHPPQPAVPGGSRYLWHARVEPR